MSSSAPQSAIDDVRAELEATREALACAHEAQADMARRLRALRAKLQGPVDKDPTIAAYSSDGDPIATEVDAITREYRRTTGRSITVVLDGDPVALEPTSHVALMSRLRHDLADVASEHPQSDLRVWVKYAHAGPDITVDAL